MSIGGIILGILNIGMIVVLLLLAGLAVRQLCKWFEYSLDPQIQKMYLLFVLLVAIYMIVAMIIGLPTISLVRRYPL